VVVFGGSGFLGSHVADELSNKDFEVIVYDLKASDYLRPGQEMVIGSILDAERVLEATRNSSYVFNFAGVADIAAAYSEPGRAIEVNVLGNTNIIEACRIHQVKRFVFASSIYVYSDQAPFYRSSKQACELIIEDYQKVFGLDYTILRYGSLYGPRANNFNFIYKIIKQAIDEGKITRKGDGEEVRDYIHVIDAARCSVEILGEEFRNQHVMITGTQSTKVSDLLNMIQEIFQGKVEVEYIRGHNDGHYEITPYSFRPRVAKKFVSNYYYDLGQGILDVIYDVYAELTRNSDKPAAIEPVTPDMRAHERD
jgi:UDP-glucose 4-epimerase